MRLITLFNIITTKLYQKVFIMSLNLDPVIRQQQFSLNPQLDAAPGSGSAQNNRLSIVSSSLCQSFLGICCGALNLHNRSIIWLNKAEQKLDEILPNNQLQEKIDQMAAVLAKKLSPLTDFNRWLDSNGQGAWYSQMATFLVKLPVRVARNIISMIYDIIYAAAYTMVHPIKATVRLAKLVVTLAHELSKPETWTKIGIGIIGGSLGQTCLSFQPFSVMGIGIGAALALAGISVGALKHAIQAERGQKSEAVIKYLGNQCLQLPETLLTGLSIGLLIGGIQRLVQPTEAQLQAFADQVVKDHNLPSGYTVEISPPGKIRPSGTVNIIWSEPESGLYDFWRSTGCLSQNGSLSWSQTKVVLRFSIPHSPAYVWFYNRYGRFFEFSFSLPNPMGPSLYPDALPIVTHYGSLVCGASPTGKS